MEVLTENVSEHSIWGCVAAYWSKCSCWPAVISTYADDVSVTTGPRSTGLMNHVFFNIMSPYLERRWHQGALREEGKLAEAA